MPPQRANCASLVLAFCGLGSHRPPLKFASVGWAACNYQHVKYLWAPSTVARRETGAVARIQPKGANQGCQPRPLGLAFLGKGAHFRSVNRKTISRTSPKAAEASKKATGKMVGGRISPCLPCAWHPSCPEASLWEAKPGARLLPSRTATAPPRNRPDAVTYDSSIT